MTSPRVRRICELLVKEMYRRALSLPYRKPLWKNPKYRKVMLEAVRQRMESL